MICTKFKHKSKYNFLQGDIAYIEKAKRSIHKGE